jgi:hypothetical protein
LLPLMHMILLDLYLASNLWGLDLDLYTTFGSGFGFVCYVLIRIWICSPGLGVGLDLMPIDPNPKVFGEIWCH